MENCFRALVESGKRIVTVREMIWEARMAIAPQTVPEFASIA